MPRCTLNSSCYENITGIFHFTEIIERFLHQQLGAQRPPCYLKYSVTSKKTRGVSPPSVSWTPHKVTPREWKHRAEAERERGRCLERAGLGFFFTHQTHMLQSVESRQFSARRSARGGFNHLSYYTREQHESTRAEILQRGTDGERLHGLLMSKER